MNTINTGETIPTEYIYIVVFEGISRGLKPLIEFSDFAIFDKPTNLMVHPISKVHLTLYLMKLGFILEKMQI